MIPVDDNGVRIHWDAIFKCAREYKQTNPDLNDKLYSEYLRDTWGVDHGTQHIRIVDERKYSLLLVRWS